MRDLVIAAFADELEKQARNPFLAMPGGSAMFNSALNAAILGSLGVSALTGLGRGQIEDVYRPPSAKANEKLRLLNLEHARNPSIGSLETLLSAEDAASSAARRGNLAGSWSARKGFAYPSPGESVSADFPRQPDPWRTPRRSSGAWDPEGPL